MWGDPKVSIKRLLTNGTLNWNAAGTPATSQIARAGIIQRIDLLTDASVTATLGSAGSIARDIWGPWNTYSQISVIPNDGAPLRRHSGYGGWLDMLLRSTEPDFPFSADVVAVAEIGAAAISDIYAFPTTGSSVDYRFYLSLPVTQRINDLEDTFGYFPTDNPQVQLNVNLTPAGSTSASPYTISSGSTAATSATLFPYLTDSGSSVTAATPTVDVRRVVWQTPQSEKDDPNYNYIIQVQEDQPQGTNANSATTQQYKFVANSGVLLRMACAIVDGGAQAAASKLTATNALEMLYGINEAKFQETAFAAHVRMHELYKFNWPEGVYSWDFLGPRLGLADTIDLSYLQEVRLNLNFASALGSSGSKVIILHERLVPVGNVRPGR